MTYKEFFEKKERLEQELNAELDNDFNILVQEMNDKYADYIDKKVQITIKDSYSNDVYIGFFGGFCKDRGYDYYLKLLLYHMKKDGTKGKSTDYIYGLNSACNNFDIKLI